MPHHRLTRAHMPAGVPSSTRPRTRYRPGRDAVQAPRRSATGGRSWRPQPARPQSTIVCWSGAEAWLTALAKALQTPEGRAARRWETGRSVATVSVQMVLDVAAMDAATADSQTGRSVATAHETVAKALGCAKRPVERARAAIERLGYAVTVTEGRHLTAAERRQAHQHHGGRQIAAASERALTLPRPPAAQPDTTLDDLPRSGCSSRNVYVPRVLPTRATARAVAAPQPPNQQLQRRAARRSPRTPQDRPTLPVQRLAARLAARLPWLGRGHSWSLCRTLTRAGIDPRHWTAHDLIEALDQRNRNHGLYALPASSIRCPLAYLAAQLREILAETTEAPGLRRAREADERHAAQERRRREREAEAAERARLAADPAAQRSIAAAKRQIHATIAAVRQRQRYTR